MNEHFPAVQRKFKDLSFIDASKATLPQHHRRNSAIESYVVKVVALYATSFDEVLMLDCDSTPLSDPTQLFEDPSYLAAGNIFWPDFATDTGTLRLAGLASLTPALTAHCEGCACAQSDIPLGIAPLGECLR